MPRKYPVFEVVGGWAFTGMDGMLGPYSTYERACEKYDEYWAYVITAPACHHA